MSSLGLVMKTSERLLAKVIFPLQSNVLKLGVSPDFNAHFHVAPVSEDLLAEISKHPGYSDNPDGNDAIVFEVESTVKDLLPLAKQKNSSRRFICSGPFCD